MDCGNVNPTQHLPWWLRETTKRTPITLVSTGIWTRNSPKTRPVWGNSIDCMLCGFKNSHRPYFTIGGSWNKSLQLQPLQRCYCENSGSPASACVMRRHYCITYTQSLHAINDFQVVGLVGNFTSLMSLVNPWHLLPWWLRVTTKITPMSLITPGFEFETLRIRVQCDEFRSALCSVQ